MKRVLIIFMFFVFLVGCSDSTIDYANEIEKLREENQELKKHNDELYLKYNELEEKNNELEEKTNQLEKENKQLQVSSANLQIADRTSRQIMKNIANGNFDTIKDEYNAEFELNEANDEILFTKLENNSYFPTELFASPMYVAYKVNTDEGVDIAYFISHDPNAGDILVYFHYDNEWNFEYIGWGH